MNVIDYDFELPNELIAQKAINPRDHSKLLLYNRKKYFKG